MNKSLLRLYAPFLAVVVVQAMFIAVAPSQPALRQAVDAIDPDNRGFTTAEGGVIDPETGEFIPSDVTGSGSPGAGTTSRRTPTRTGGTPGTSPGGGGGGGVAAGDTSHCKGDRQFDFLHLNPKCTPKWPDGADNGGATYQGVTATEIKIVLFNPEENRAVNSILVSQGLGRSEDQYRALYEAAADFINKNYELYGRKVVFVRRIGQCPQSPPDVDACLASARKVIKEDKPFMVLWDSGLYPDVFNEFARAGVIALGGWHFSEEFFTGFRPFRYDVFMDGTRSAQLLAEYYCKNLAGKKASHSGLNIHPTIGDRNAVRRRLGISVPDVTANLRTAELVKQLVMECDPGAEPPVIQAYVSDIERAPQQANTTAANYIAARVTTITCMCDPIAPLFSTRAYTANNYYPEHMLSGIGLIDFDKLGRLYEPSQWAHAFGPSHLQVQPAHSDSDASRMYRAAGRSGEPCAACNLPWAYMALAASMIQSSGPVLNPVNLERGALSGDLNGRGWAQHRNPTVVQLTFGPGDYTGIADLKEVYWSDRQASTIDGQPRAYVSLNGGQRYTAGNLPARFEERIPVAAQ